jgi:hypothetical protein
MPGNARYPRGILAGILKIQDQEQEGHPSIISSMRGELPILLLEGQAYSFQIWRAIDFIGEFD